MMINDILIDHNLKRNDIFFFLNSQYPDRKRKGKTNCVGVKASPLTKVQAIPKQKPRVAFDI